MGAFLRSWVVSPSYRGGIMQSMHKPTNDDTKDKLLRLPRQLHDDVADIARRNERNVEAEIRVALRRHVKAERARQK